MAILIVLLGLGGAFFAPNERKAAELARDDPGSAAYMAVVGRSRRSARCRASWSSSAIFFMVAKPGGY